MSIRRAPHQTEYAVIHNDALRDPTLSFKARGILALLLSMPDDWRVNDRWLTRQGPDGRDAIQTGLRELESAGYLRRQRTRNSFGQWAHESVVYESPKQEDAPWTGFPATDNPAIEEVPREEVPISSSTRANARDDLFDLFWSRYPRKVAKASARKAWDQAKERAGQLDIVEGAERYARECETAESARFIAHPATWLNGDRWLDEPDQDPNLGMLARIVAEERSKPPELNP